MRIFLATAISLLASAPTLAPDITPCEEQADLSPETLDVGDEYGYSVASRLVIGAPSHDGKGAVFVYSFNGTTWDLESTIIPNQLQAGDRFGHSVSLARHSSTWEAYSTRASLICTD